MKATPVGMRSPVMKGFTTFLPSGSVTACTVPLSNVPTKSVPLSPSAICRACGTSLAQTLDLEARRQLDVGEDLLEIRLRRRRRLARIRHLALLRLGLVAQEPVGRRIGPEVLVVGIVLLELLSLHRQRAAAEHGRDRADKAQLSLKLLLAVSWVSPLLGRAGDAWIDSWVSSVHCRASRLGRDFAPFNMRRGIAGGGEGLAAVRCFTRTARLPGYSAASRTIAACIGSAMRFDWLKPWFAAPAEPQDRTRLNISKFALGVCPRCRGLRARGQPALQPLRQRRAGHRGRLTALQIRRVAAALPLGGT